MRNSLSSHWSSTPRKKITMHLSELARFTQPQLSTPQHAREIQKTRVKQPLERVLTKSQILEGYLKMRPKFMSHKTSLRKIVSRSTSVKEITIPPREALTESTIHTQTVSPRVAPTRTDIEAKLNILLNREYNQGPNFRYLIKEVNNKKRIGINYKELTRLILSRFTLLRKLGLSYKNMTIFSTKPFQRPDSYQFLQACKLGDLLTVEEMLKRDKFLPFIFDYIHLSPLHWAVKRNHMKIVIALLYNGCDVNAEDLIGRPPIHFAVEQKNYNMVKILLEHQASPWTTQKITYSKLCEDDAIIMMILNKARRIHVVVRLICFQKRIQIKDKQLTGLFEL